MGSVYRARERASGREVALKILYADSSSAASRFLREGQVTASLNHPGVVRIHSIGTLGGKPCLAYELVPGARSFEAAVGEDPASAIPLLVQAGRALGAAHTLGLTHRDVKSENLLVDREGRLRVSDFGLVTGEELSRLTQSGAWVGTPQTMPPEQFGDRAAIGPASDVWSLGVLLYWALAGRYPFASAESMIELASAITAGDYVPPSRLRPTPAALEEVCLRALRTTPTERYPNGDAFADALEAAQAAPAQTGAARRGLWVLGLGLALLLPLGAAAWAARPDPPPPAPSASAGSPTPPPLASPTPSSTPSAPGPGKASPEDAIPPGVMGWEPSRGGSLGSEVLDYPYREVETSFEHLLYALRNGYGPETELRVARALLSGSGVQRDLTPALEILRHGAKEDRRAAQVLLVETLAAEGMHEEELLWVGRFAQYQPRPYDLHRLWQLTRGRDPRAKRARAIWGALRARTLRAPVLAWVRGGARRRVDDIRADPPERTRFLIEAITEGWRRDTSEWSDWQLSVALDYFDPAQREALVSYASPSPRLARLCLRRRDPAELLQPAIAATLARASEDWLLEVLETLLARRLELPCLTAILRKLEKSSSVPARRWLAVCQAQGFGLPASRRGLQVLEKLRAEGDHMAGILMVAGAPKGVSVDQQAQVLGPGVRAGHPPSLLAYARLVARSRDERRRLDGLKAFRQAAQAGHVDGLVAYWRHLRRSARTPAELTKAYSYLDKAAHAGSALALEAKSICLRAGLGCERDAKKARWVLKEACWRGRAEASVRFGNLLLEPVPGEEDGYRVQRLTIAYDHFERASRQTGALSARLGRARSLLAAPERARAGRDALEALTEEAPTSQAATEFGRLLLESEDFERAERVLEGAAARRTAALDLLLQRWRSSGRGARAASYLERALAAKQPSALIVAARERFAAQPDWARQTLLELGSSRPQAHSVLGELLWERNRGEDRREAYRLWLRAEARGNESARAALIRNRRPE